MVFSSTAFSPQFFLEQISYQELQNLPLVTQVAPVGNTLV